MKRLDLWIGLVLVIVGIVMIARDVTIRRSPFTPGQWECYKAGTLEHVTFIVNK